MTIEFSIIITLLVIVLGEVSYIALNQRQRVPVKTKGRMMFVDTSVLIDGRIIAVATSGFLSDTIAIPRSVTRELQLLADGSSTDKRARARYGLDVVKELQDMSGIDVMIFDDDYVTARGVDERLIRLAKEYAGSVICTIDYNLNKVATIEGVRVVNVNELAQQLRMSYLPGERLLLELTQKGQDGHQAIGHLKDGTMVVVEHAVKKIGSSVEVEFIRSIQTAAGKMMFAKVIEKPQEKVPTAKESPKQKSAGRRPSPQPQQAAVQQAVRKQPQKKDKPAQKKQRSGRVDHEAALLDLVDKQ